MVGQAFGTLALGGPPQMQFIGELPKGGDWALSIAFNHLVIAVDRSGNYAPRLINGTVMLVIGDGP
jgi:hypothetical protein